MNPVDGPHKNLGLSRSMRVIADGLDHCEGITWDQASGRLLVGSEAGVVRSVDADSGAAEVIATLPGWVLGLVVDGAGVVVACVVGDATGIWMGAPDGSVRQLPTPPITFPNHLAFAADGTLYVTDSGDFGAHNGSVLAVAPDGTTTTLAAGINRFPNGCAVSPDGRELWVVESFGPSVVAVDLATGETRTIAYLHGTVPDGIAFCTDGSAVITSYRPDRLYWVSADGATRIVADDPYGALLNAPTNCTFAGPSADRLVAVNFGRWHITEIDGPLVGAPLNQPANWAGSNEKEDQ